MADIGGNPYILFIAATVRGSERTEMTTMTVSIPAKVAAPRGATWAANAFAAFLNWLEAVSETRTDRRAQADRLAEAARVRIYAQDVMAQDPRFAADLFAAADRHERG